MTAKEALLEALHKTGILDDAGKRDPEGFVDFLLEKLSEFGFKIVIADR